MFPMHMIRQGASDFNLRRMFLVNNVKLNLYMYTRTIFLLEWTALTNVVDKFDVSICKKIILRHWRTTFSGDGVESFSLSCKLSKNEHDQPLDRWQQHVTQSTISPSQFLLP